MKDNEWVSPTLKKADDIINGERQDQYGDPEDSFALIGEYWTTYLTSKMGEIIHLAEIEAPGFICIKSEDVAAMMTLFKIARMSGQKWHPDNAVDACGYLAILNDRIKGE